MPNPKPIRSPKFQASQYPAATDVEGELADRPICVKLPKEIDEWVRVREDKSVWLRQAIVAAYQREMRNPEAVPDEPHS